MSLVFRLLFLLISAAVPGAGEAADKKLRAVTGWPLPEISHKQPPAWLGNDPVLGRLICPPISRYNLIRKDAEGLFFQDVLVSSHPNGTHSWRFNTRNGLFWWDGSAVTARDLGEYIERALPEGVSAQAGALWKIPTFSWSTQGERSIIITWKEQPAFGPWVLNGRAFFRPRKAASNTRGLAWECAGIYKAEKVPEGFLLEPSEPYGQASHPLFIASTTAVGTTKVLPATGYESDYKFSMAETLSANPTERPPDKAPFCRNLIEIPWLSLISWNSRSPILSKASMRQVLTGLTPRGALLRAGAGFQGDLISSLIPRTHPAYQSRIWVREFDLEKASASLNRMGYTRPRGDSLRQSHSRRPLTLSLASLRNHPGILEKVLVDSFLAVGIKTRFFPSPEKGERNKMDGVITGAYLDWPELNFLPNFHSRSEKTYPFWPPQDRELDQLLETYALSLTQGRPDFRTLGKVHNLLYILEPVTVLMQHKICLSGPGNPDYRIDITDPDWFRKIIL